ncbi:4-hydroxybutyrate coenzyme a transferase, putative [Heliomicrobium modesticaldum Ice1]|uniref:Probable butyrate:acetyl-CoA coenzyme A-transferase n=1 Tax=Heliobacterium modesticaldum (strain ATCC 51547 / Ice1) TaxID=498761 RepID=B0TCP9_HELMI|nr:acetyl-CoA hydrolase/transferase C-terminal domain-containing protein [Heliomicrobium modesticaldum]ABZ84075.1 4-hydroxybutyrate coenzyme a transferase, putative [Heliomicrobium modesticaldum Ice1]
MSLQDQYRSKRITAREAARMVKSGDWIEYGFCLAAPRAFDAALAERCDDLTDVHIRAGVSVYPSLAFESDPTGERFTWNSWHFSGLDRRYASQGSAFYIPMRFRELPRYVLENQPTDVFVTQAAPMDRYGFFNFGVSNSHHYGLIARAKKIIIEVNEHFPRVHGGHGHGIHIDQVDHIIEGDNLPLAELPPASVSDVDKAIATQVLAKMHDGDCVQLGIGGMPNALGRMIAESDLKDLGGHTEMIADSFVDMFQAGRMNGLRKAIDRGRIAFTFALGTKRLYDFLDENPFVASYPVDYTNATEVAGSIDNLVTINNAVEVDLFGQVCAESSGTRQISGTGGQLDFVIAAYRSKGGRSFICLSSTYRDKAGNIKSRILPTITPGGIITDTRATTMYVVTEYGMFNCKGQSTWQRAEGLIGIAHPQFREELISKAEAMGIWRRSNKR